MTYLRTNRIRPNANALNWPIGLGDLEKQLGTIFAGLPELFESHQGAAQRPVARHAKLRWYEKDDAYLVRIDLAGVKKEDVQIELEDGSVAVSAVRKSESATEEGKASELKYSNTFRVPEEVKQEAVAASFENGVLSLTLPKSEKAQPRQISIG
ncbi:Hsp20/alpha crystallin family protein [Pelagicoccus sp. SDUM812002]|uniref:Hsp20/alpha crystallin family protein n=1 Tax=Pelagicoccus sp. SDUM812002 TaxID=3041266 RepID=UPI00280FC2D8|nr:Hsp20/alpha crystallin family protein [Pelagicoccus sp. SDUM812002]MDQ8185979.1 Hsp20/alpha crystallin family protein [Pelagicoccus sp. SDUM812002]